jgi:hypothetical protein
MSRFPCIFKLRAILAFGLHWLDFCFGELFAALGIFVLCTLVYLIILYYFLVL